MDTPDHGSSSSIDLNATGAAAPLPTTSPGAPGRESHERTAALKRGSSLAGTSTDPLCAPDIPHLDARLLYTLVAENVRDYAVFLTDVDGIIRCWGESARLMKWWTKHQAEGAHLRMLYPDGGSEDGTAESHLLSAAETGEYNGEGHRVRSDGSTFWAYVTLTALRNADGELVGFTKVTRDFSARRAVESALRQERSVPSDSQKALDETTRIKRLVANLSHELRTPLNAILGSVQLLTAGREAKDKDRSHIERLQRNTRHLISMLDDVLEMARAESGQLTLTPGVQRLASVIEDALADVEAQAAAQHLTISNAVSGGAADLPYWGDPGRVRQILVNLLTNATKFTGPDGRVTISGGTGESVTGAILSGPGPWVYVRVEDTGRGIPPEHLEAIFEPFQQTEIADQQRGTGLGLSISRQFARLMGGDLIAESEVGVGSRFTLWLPIAPSEPVPR
jgi:PAS domain S-box-containing protein